MAERAGFTLVLGGGGWPAHAYLSGVFAAFADAGIEPSNAAHVVGTSAGALNAGLIGAGLSALELSRAAGRFSESADERPFTRSWSGGGDLAARGRGALKVLLALASRNKRLRKVPENPRWGMLATRDPQRYFGQLPTEWPNQQLTFVCWDLTDGCRRGLTASDALGLPIRDAVAASMALPAVMAPVTTGRHLLVDGGCASATNLDAARRANTRLTICVAPMSYDPEQPPSGLLRAAYGKANRTLGSQAALVRSEDQEVVLIRPSAAALRAMGGNPFGAPQTSRIATAARADAARCLSNRRTRALLDSVGA